VQALIDALGAEGTIAQAMLIGTLLVMRILPIMFQTPFLGGRVAPPETRIGLSVGLTILVYPYAVAGMQGPLAVNGIAYVVLMFKELFIGYVIGFVAAEIFYAMEIGGRTLDIMRGSNMAEVQVPELQFRASPIGQFNFQLLLVVFCVLDGFGFFIESVIESFRVVPIDGWPVMQVGLEHLVDQVLHHSTKLFTIAMALVFPGAFAAFVVDIVFGMFNRIAPQLNAYFMAMGVKAMAGLAMFMFSLSLMVGQLAHHLEDTLVFLRKLMTYFG
jgi:flagellar biosynthetic protein FliR